MIAGAHVTANSAFDEVASSYDLVFEGNPMTRVIRPIIWQTLFTYFRAGSRVLDLSCGTGTDAIALAKRAVHVTAIDASSRMIREAREKIRLLDLPGSVEILDMRMEEIGAPIGENFDGAFSNFGGLNCVVDLPAMIRRIAGSLKPGGVFIGCLLNKYALWEMLSFLLRGHGGTAFRRLNKDGVMANIGGTCMSVRYYSTRQVSLNLSEEFTVQEIYGLNILSPSPNSEKFINRHPEVTRRLLTLDTFIRRIAPFNGLGDHFVIVARRRDK